MMMTGPGGTGKTHVVKTLAHLMSAFGCGHLIRFLAPTGTAAALINGTTLHSGFGIDIKKKKNTCDSNQPGVLINIKNKASMRREWKDVLFVLIDEVSMVSQQLLAEIDYSLRYAKENKQEWFGGMNIIFAGDFCQFPPRGWFSFIFTYI
jgi:ATP-dependent exoDNAse (exonuclease V) alpha subunit